ncbi:unnamed protein product, partial [Coregonus sp. 'balchen']
YFKNRKYNPTVLLQEIMSRLFPLQLAERKQVHETEMAELSKNPYLCVFGAYRRVPVLPIFEPRYRLMMRRCMETGTKKFGMCSYEHGKGRFRVLKRGQRDGYQTADIEYMEDHKAEGSEFELLQSLHDSVYEQAQDWYTRLTTRIREQISRQYGTMPDKDDNIQDRLGHLRIVLEYFSQS